MYTHIHIVTTVNKIEENILMRRLILWLRSHSVSGDFSTSTELLVKYSGSFLGKGTRRRW